MIQRIQSIYLVVAFLFSGINILLFSNKWMQVGLFDILGLTAGTCVLSILVIFLFKKRAFQIKLNQLNLLLNLSIIGLLIYHLLNLPTGIHSLKKNIDLIIPLTLSVVVIVFLWFSNRAIKKDERLVKSIDRIR